MKRFLLLSMLIMILSLISCQKNQVPISNQEPLYSSENDMSEAIVSLIELVDEIWELKPTASYEDVESFVWDEFGNQIIDTKSNESYEVSHYAFKVLNQMQAVDPSEYMTKDNYVVSLSMIIDTNANNLTEYERNALYLTAVVSSEIIELKYGNLPLTKAEWWDKTKAWVKKQWNDWGKCAAGILGGVGGGFLGGAAAGSAVPGLGTTVGGVVGGISGGLGGAAAAC